MSFFFFLILFVLSSYGKSYVPGTEDIPLIEGAVIEESPTIFDKVEGRVAIIKAHAFCKTGEVESFYEETLPNLGWTKIGRNRYQRGTQFLNIKTGVHECRTEIIFEMKENS